MPPRLQVIQTPLPSRWRFRESTNLVLFFLSSFLLTISASARGQLSTDAQQLKEQAFPPFGPPGAEGNFGGSQIAGDFNGDGFDDLAVSQKLDGGRVYLFAGGEAGLVFQETLTEFSTSGYGEALAVCDFNDDDVDDLVVGAPFTSVEGEARAGAVFAYLGGSEGLVLVQSLTQDDLGRKSLSNEEFGGTLASGDYDGDGNCDLAVASPREDDTTFGANRGDTSTFFDVGEVHVIYGLGNGLFGTDDALSITELTIPLPGGEAEITIEPFDNFGTTLATLARPEVDALIVGIPRKRVGGLSHVGRVWRVEFTERALAESAYVDLEDLPFLVPPTSLEMMGSALAVLGPPFPSPTIAIGIPRDRTDGVQSGAVFLIPAAEIGSDSPSGVALFGSQFDLGPGLGDDFGDALHSGDFNGDGSPDLAIGVPDKVGALRGGGGSAPLGAVHVLYAGASAFSDYQTFVESDLGFARERDDFGMSLAAGDFFGTGSESLAIGAPRRDGEAPLSLRGSLPTDNHGVVYVLPAQDMALRGVSLVARTGEALPGEDRVVTELSDAAASASGAPGVRGRFETGESFVLIDDRVVFEDSDGPATIQLLGERVDLGFALAGSELFGHIDRMPTNRGNAPPGDFDVLVTRNGLFTELEPVPGGSVGSPRQLVSSRENRLYFLGEESLAVQRILRTEVGFGGPLEVVTAVGDPMDGVFVKSIDRFDVSPDGSHLAFTGVLGEIADHPFLVVDGDRVVFIEESFFEDDRVLEIPRFAVNDEGRYVFTARLADESVAIYSGIGDSVTAKISAPILDSVDVSGLEPANVSFLDSGSVLHLWTGSFSDSELSSQEVLFVTCAGPADSRKVLQTGDVLALGTQPELRTQVVRIYPVNSTEGLEDTGDGHLFVRVGLRRGFDRFDAVIELGVACRIFGDDFESGSPSAWSSSVRISR